MTQRRRPSTSKARKAGSFAKLKSAARPSAIDLFCGCGGLSLGLKNAGFSVVAAVDTDALACATYRANHRATLLLEKDIQDIDPAELMVELGLKEGELGLLAGCPPCQGFSTLRTLNGGKKISEPMNDLVFQFSRFIKVFKPKSVMVENVPGLAGDERLAKFRGFLSAMGYKSCIDVFDAADFGVPQRRRRMILLAARGTRPEFAAPAKRKRSVRSAIANLPAPQVTTDPAHNHPADRAPHVMDIIRRIPKDGGSRRELGEDAQLPCHRKCNGFKDIYGRMSWDKPSPTITGGCINPSKGRFLHPEQDRAITLREAAMLQGFPVNYRFDLSKGRYPAAQMIGNAFPPAFAAHHAKSLRGLISCYLRNLET
ncbi:DNA cytosine methyltransferase [Hyphomicrobium sp. LHD-15]|uniref:DNA cytosine methyltransferase n=1 Tax=Hyphomicrobium sp. LHD-15 TaxID=3072142 RepID=UPI00280E54CD|nr:DNA cytosine methyltransferase [Hyphomicrobium sp. LHD-15]MDQ8698165.1 DNA cytosine methyltransferase [Hyphomicrobium sp. LHD-15]